jgi:hypothetical protein
MHDSEHEPNTGGQLHLPVLTIDQVLRSQEMSLSRLLSTGTIADGRGAVIISSNIAMQGALVASLSGAPILKSGGMLIALMTLNVALSVGSLAAAAIAAFPRAQFRGPSVVFFASISRMSENEYYKKLRTISGTDYARDLTEQCHRVASLITFKFRCIRWAMALLIAAALPWLGCLHLANKLPIPA